MKRLDGLNATLAIFLSVVAGCAKNPSRATPESTGTLSGDVARNSARAKADTESAATLIEQSRYPDAEPILKRALEADPMYGPARNDLGIVYYHLNRLYEAAWQFENAIKLMPGQPEPHNNLGLVLEQAGKNKEAISAYATAAQLAPDNPVYLGNLARARVRSGLRDDETRRVLEALLLRDDRPEWVDWERLTLLRMRAQPAEESATTHPSNPLPPP